MRTCLVVAMLVASACRHPAEPASDAQKKPAAPKDAGAGAAATATQATAGTAVNPPPVAAPADLASHLQLTPIARKLKRPVLVTAPPGDARLFIVEQVGRIRVLANGAVLDAPFLDVSSLVSRGNEQGLLGLAFHPGYAKNGRFFIYYTNTDGDTRVVEYHVSSADPDVADPKPVRTLLEVKQPYSNHNGGNIVFGPDGLLWIGLGDGGAANDPHGNGQSDASLLAKMLRIDVDASPPKPITQFKGLRNPWRWAFDAKTGDLYIGDVGQNKYEEVDAVPAATAAKGGLNFGWNRMEGLHCFADDACASNQADLTLPVVEYDHASGTGCSVTGGVVYRGKALPELDGMYFYSDYCTCFLRSFRYDAATNRISAHYDWQKLGKKLTAISSFGTDAAGELYVVSLDGIVWRLDRKP